MKKKVVAVILSLAMTAGITACTNTGSGESTAAPESTQQMEQSQESKESSAVDETKESESQEESEALQSAQEEDFKEIMGEVFLESGYSGTNLFVLDQDGNKRMEVNYDQLIAKLLEKGYDFSSAMLKTAGNGALFFYQYDYENSESKWTFYAVDPKTLEVCELGKAAKYSMSAMDYYQGKLYISMTANGSERVEYVYEKEPSSFSFHQCDPEIADGLKATEAYASIFCCDPEANVSEYNVSYTRAFLENGFVICLKDAKYVKVAKDGQITELQGMPTEYVNIVGYDDNYVIYSTYNESGNIITLVDTQTGDRKLITGENQAVGYLGYTDGVLYYYIDQGTEYGISKNQVYTFDTASKETKKAYSCNTVPGTDVNPGVTGFHLIGGKPYFADVMGNELKWVRVEAQGLFADLGCTIKNYDLFNYGSVAYKSGTQECPYCGITTCEYYLEGFQLNSGVSAKADVINAALTQILEQTAAAETPYEEITSDEMCEDHKEYPTQFCVSDEETVSGVKILNDKYLVIDMSGYWYAGGAHGYPHRNQYVFDLTTGEKVTLKSLFKGTEEDFKKLVAEKTAQNFESYSEDMNPYYAQTKEDVYQQAYDAASLETSYVELTEDGAWLVYAPYEMGAYAYGYIDVQISYQDLIGRDTL